MRGGGARRVLEFEHVSPELGEDRAFEIVLEQEPGGSHRIVALSALDRTKQGPKVLYGIIVKGWCCPKCGQFTGEEKELQATCMLCALPRPDSP